jgi:hypothetical protein
MSKTLCYAISHLNSLIAIVLICAIENVKDLNCLLFHGYNIAFYTRKCKCS